MSDTRKLIFLLTIVTLARLAFAAAMPLLSAEAYYWLWNWHPAAGYFDHPPMVALVGRVLGGRILNSPLAARLPAIILSIFSTLSIYTLARSMFPASRTAWRAALLFTLAPVLDLNGMNLGPDNALILFTSLSWLTFWRAAQSPIRLSLWLLAGLAAGLALLSKFHAWVLLPPLYFFLLLSPRHRPLLKTAGPYLALAIALIVLSPNLYWNAQHDWLNYTFQWHRSALPRAHFNPGFIAGYLAAPLATLSPLIYAAVLIGIVRAIKLWRTASDPRWLFLLCAGLPLPLFLGLLTPLTEISLHWPAPAYGALLILVAALHDSGHLFTPRLYQRSVALLILMAAILHLAPFIIPLLPAAAGSPLHTSRLRAKAAGWPEIGALARRHIEALQQQDPSHPALIMSRSWHMTSSLMFYAGLPLAGSPLNAEDLHNFSLWNASAKNLQGTDAVVILENDEPNNRHDNLLRKYDEYHRLLDPLFEKVEEQPSLICFPDGSAHEYLGVETKPPRLREFLVFRCHNFHGTFIPAED